MFTFASFPISKNEDPYNYDRSKHPEVEEEDYMNLDFDEEDFASGSKLTYPGEAITSAHAFMRSVFIPIANMSVLILLYLEDMAPMLKRTK